MTQKKTFEALNSRSSLGAFYANYILYPKLKKYLNGHVLDYGAGVGNFTKFYSNFGKITPADINKRAVNTMSKSGLHNDYMRIYFRTGILGLIFSFIPIFYFFFIFFIFSYQQYFYKKRTDIIYLLFILLTFIPYYSLFAYPRESTYQSGTFWLSMFLVYGYLSNNYKKYK